MRLRAVVALYVAFRQSAGSDFREFRVLSDRTAKRSKQTLCRSEIGSSRLSESYVQRDNCPESHRRPPSVKSATWRKKGISTFA